MILIFGGTTEGRTAVDVCEQAGKPFWYATRGHEQEVPLLHGQRLAGGMDAAAIAHFCRSHAIRLIVDAGHPFAEHLHQNLASVAEELQLPLVRFDRIYPPRTPDIVWCKDYADALRQLQEHGVGRLLALTGVQTIGRLKPFWQQHECWFRILDRDSSRAIAEREGFPKERLIEVSDDSARGSRSEVLSSISALSPDAIITKESGVSGGFVEKVEAARAAGVKIFAIERPFPQYAPHLHLSSLTPQPTSLTPQPSALSPHPSALTTHPSSLTPQSRPCPPFSPQLVNGPHGLRRAIESLLPDFFTLHTGLTTGACATAAAVAATTQLLTGRQPEAVPIRLSNGETISVPVGFADGYAFCIKDFSDDPDVTRGCRIMATVAFRPDGAGGPPVRFLQGAGVGRVTLPGLGIPVGQPAINPVPRQMIADALRQLTDAALDVTISVEHGQELAARTFNHRVGVVDGISIIGTTGIVTPLSNDAFVASIGRELQVARAIGCDSIGLASGKRGEEQLLAAEPGLRVVHYGNFVGESLRLAHQHGFGRVVLGILIGKAVKLAEGHLDTHSHKVLMNKQFLIDLAHEAGVPNAETIVGGITMARELWQLMPPHFFQLLTARIYAHCRTAFPTGQLEIKLFPS